MQRYDVCIVCLNKTKNDARVLNLAGALSKLGKKVLVVGVGSFDSEIFDVISIDLDLNKKLYLNMPLFTLKLLKIRKSIIADYYVAGELYSFPATILLSRYNNAKLIYDSREIFSALGNTFDKPLKQMFFTYLEKSSIHLADKIIVSGRLDAEFLKDFYPKVKSDYHLIMNVPKYKNVVKSNLLRENFSIPKNKKIILYQGMIMRGRGLEISINIMKSLVNHVLVILGSGDRQYKKDLIELSESEGIKGKVFFKDFVEYDKVHEWTCSADIGLALFEPISKSYELALPNKLFEYAMANIPSITTNLPAIRDVNLNPEFTCLVDYPFNINELVRVVEGLDNSAKYECYRLNSQIASRIYNYESQQSEIKRIFDIL
ncbi:MAG: glycosyltransferase family 4 protein [Candidatus Kapaibacterium sp.]